MRYCAKCWCELTNENQTLLWQVICNACVDDIEARVEEEARRGRQLVLDALDAGTERR